eukprot:XP_012810357.1 PREDICTED: phospholipase A2 inhibitor and Ly6/PLAUR domain-containing protein-like [Xenopus tropicalis]
MDFYFGETKTGSSCCYTDNCIPPTPTLPEDNFQLNGLSCPAGLSFNSLTIFDAEDDVQCSGDETKCALLTMSVFEIHATLRGCSNKNICDFGSYSFDILGDTFNFTVLCTDNHQHWEF